MAIPNRNRSNNIPQLVRTKSRNSRIQDNHKPLKFVAILAVMMLCVPALFSFFNSNYRPSLLKSTDEKLNEVVDICSMNEDSSECFKIKKKYNMTFKYCKKIENFSSLDVTLYGVAWEGDSSEPPQQQYSVFNYYDCQEHMEWNT